MVALWIEILLLMGAAYFLGAALACVIRRSLHAESVASADRRVDPLPEVAQRRAEPARFGRAPEPARKLQPAAPAVARPAPAPAPPKPAPQVQDLERIRPIDPALAAGLSKLGVTRYDQIAAWMRADVLSIGEALGLAAGRINRENWIEQAQVLAKGGETDYSVRRARGEGASAAPTPDEGEGSPPAPSGSQPLPRPMSRAGVSAAVVTAAPPPAAAVEPAPRPDSAATASPPLVAERAAFAVPVRPAPEPERDNLQRIGGITAEVEQALAAQGVSRYSQIALWSPAEVERFDRQLGTRGRIARENWIEQAQILGRGGDTRFSREFDRQGRSDAPPPRPIKLPDAIREHEAARAAEAQTGGTAARADLGSLRSVRSEAYQNAPEPGPEAARRAATRAAGSVPSDLKRIRGIGVLIEKRLNTMGVASYEQIANWTAEDIAHFSRSLDFKGRIERENWVEQARILASGGSTEFSRRMDKGELEGAGRPKA
jgi:predicted flap endonuclease-1-like 5' DNA nuclease